MDIQHVHYRVALLWVRCHMPSGILTHFCIVDILSTSDQHQQNTSLLLHSLFWQNTLLQNVICSLASMDRDTNISPKTFCSIAFLLHAPDALTGAWQMMNAPRSYCTSTQALIKLWWSVRGQVRAVLHPSFEFQQASPFLATRSPKSALIDTLCKSLLAQPSTTMHLPTGSLCSST